MKTLEKRGLTSLRCITNDMNKSFPDVGGSKAKQSTCKDRFKVGTQKSKAMDHNALSSMLTNLNRAVSNTNKLCQFTQCTKINISDDSSYVRYSS